MGAPRIVGVLLGNAILFGIFVLAGQVRAEIPRFQTYQIAEVGRSMGQTSLVDVDRDGDLDMVTAEQGSDTISVGGDVVEDIITRELEGASGVVDHAVDTDDPDYATEVGQNADLFRGYQRVAEQAGLDCTYIQGDIRTADEN